MEDLLGDDGEGLGLRLLGLPLGGVPRPAEAPRSSADPRDAAAPEDAETPEDADTLPPTPDEAETPEGLFGDAESEGRGEEASTVRHGWGEGRRC